MSKTLMQPYAPVTVEAAISTLLYLFHCGAMQARQGYQPAPRLSQSISQHLEGLCRRDDLPAVLRETCDELSDAWMLALNQDLRGMVSQQS